MLVFIPITGIIFSRRHGAGAQTEDEVRTAGGFVKAADLRTLCG